MTRCRLSESSQSSAVFQAKNSTSLPPRDGAAGSSSPPTGFSARRLHSAPPRILRPCVHLLSARSLEQGSSRLIARFPHSQTGGPALPDKICLPVSSDIERPRLLILPLLCRFVFHVTRARRCCTIGSPKSTVISTVDQRRARLSLDRIPLAENPDRLRIVPVLPSCNRSRQYRGRVEVVPAPVVVVACSPGSSQPMASGCERLGKITQIHQPAGFPDRSSPSPHQSVAAESARSTSPCSWRWLFSAAIVGLRQCRQRQALRDRRRQK